MLPYLSVRTSIAVVHQIAGASNAPETFITPRLRGNSKGQNSQDLTCRLLVEGNAGHVYRFQREKVACWRSGPR